MQKTIPCLIAFIVAAGCANSVSYDAVSTDLRSSESKNGVYGYSPRWVPLGETLEFWGKVSVEEALSAALANCSDEAAKEYGGSKAAVAAALIAQCMSENGWKLRMEEWVVTQ